MRISLFCMVQAIFKYAYRTCYEASRVNAAGTNKLTTLKILTPEDIIRACIWIEITGSDLSPF